MLQYAYAFQNDAHDAPLETASASNPAATTADFVVDPDQIPNHDRPRRQPCEACDVSIPYLHHRTDSFHVSTARLFFRQQQLGLCALASFFSQPFEWRLQKLTIVT
jgi:hypothetical protein